MAVIEKKQRQQPSLPRIVISPSAVMKIRNALIVVAVLAICVLMGFMVSGEITTYIGLGAIALIVMIVFMLFFSEHLNWSVWLLLFTAAFTPFSLPTGTHSRVVDSMVVTAAFFFMWMLRMFVVDKRFHLKKSASNLPLISFMIVSTLSLAWSVIFRDLEVVVWNSFPLVQLGMTAVMVLLPAAFLLVANFANDSRLLKVLTWMLIVAGPVVLFANFTGIYLPLNNGGLFAMWVMTLSLALVFFQPGLGLWLRGALLLHVAGWVVWSFVMHIDWLAGWLPGMFTIGVLVFMRSRKLFMFGILVIVVIAIIFNSYFLEALREERAISGDSRIAAWQVNWRVTSEHLLFGTGPGGYAAYYMTFFPNEGMATHNTYIDVLAQSGLVGLGLWLWFFGVTLWQGFQQVRRTWGRNDFYQALASALFAGTLACIMIMMFGDWLLPFAYTQTIAGFDYAVYSWIFMGMIVALRHTPLPEVPAVVQE